MDILDSILGIHSDQLRLIQMLMRATFVFFISILLIRIAGLRTLGEYSAFDKLTILIMGAILGRSIVAAEQPFFESILTVTLIVLFHRMLAWITFRSKIAGVIFKGKTIPLMKNHNWQTKNLRRTNITIEDIEESIRQDLNGISLSRVKDIYLERSGKISIVTAQKGVSKE